MLYASLHQLHGEAVKAKAAMKIAIVSLRCKVDGVTRGLLPSYLFWGRLLLQCGDVEQNPGLTDNMRQTRLTSGSRAANTETAVCSQVTSPNADTPTKQPTLSDVIATLQSMNNSMTRMSSKLDDVSGDIGLMR